MEVDTDSIIALMSFLVGSYIFLSKNVKFPTKKQLEERYKKDQQRKKEEKKAKEKEEKEQSISKVDKLIDTITGRSKEDRIKLEEVKRKKREKEQDDKMKVELQNFINDHNPLIQEYGKQFKKKLLENEKLTKDLINLKMIIEKLKQDLENKRFNKNVNIDQQKEQRIAEKITSTNDRLLEKIPSGQKIVSALKLNETSPVAVAVAASVSNLELNLSNLPSARPKPENLQEEEIPNSINNNTDYNQSGDKNFIYLGDLFDSSCKGSRGVYSKECDPYTIKDNFSYNIRNLRYLKNNKDNSQIFLGNRDVNKLKLLELLKFENEENWQNIFGKKANILTIAKDLSQQINQRVFQWKYNTEAKWEEGSLKPLWGQGNKEKYLNQGKWESFQSITNCNDMFDRIFGADTAVGTMSADFLKNTIYNEIKQMYNIQEEIDDEIKSAVALVVFKLLMTSSSNNDNLYNNLSKTLKDFVQNYSFVDLLQQNNVHFCKAIQSENNILCFSHSGIENNLITIDQFKEIEKKYTGEINPEPATFQNINSLNTDLREKLRDLIENKSNDISEDIYRFLYISAGFKNNHSPIVPNAGPVGYNEFTKNHTKQFNVDGKNIIQFTGHQPVGISTLFNISNKDEGKYNIVFSIDRYNNVDNLFDFDKKYKSNNSNLSLNKNKINLKTLIEFGNEPDIFNYTANKSNELTEIKNKTIYIDNEINLNTNKILFDEKGKDLSTLSNEPGNIMGIGLVKVEDDETKYRIFHSKNDPGQSYIKQLKYDVPASPLDEGDSNNSPNDKYFVSDNDDDFAKFLNNNEINLLSDLEGLSFTEYIKRIRSLESENFENKDNLIETAKNFLNDMNPAQHTYTNPPSGFGKTPDESGTRVTPRPTLSNSTSSLRNLPGILSNINTEQEEADGDDDDDEEDDDDDDDEDDDDDDDDDEDDDEEDDEAGPEGMLANVLALSDDEKINRRKVLVDNKNKLSKLYRYTSMINRPVIFGFQFSYKKDNILLIDIKAFRDVDTSRDGIISSDEIDKLILLGKTPDEITETKDTLKLLGDSLSMFRYLVFMSGNSMENIKNITPDDLKLLEEIFNPASENYATKTQYKQLNIELPNDFISLFEEAIKGSLESPKQVIYKSRSRQPVAARYLKIPPSSRRTPITPRTPRTSKKNASTAHAARLAEARLAEARLAEARLGKARIEGAKRGGAIYPEYPLEPIKLSRNMVITRFILPVITFKIFRVILYQKLLENKDVKEVFIFRNILIDISLSFSLIMALNVLGLTKVASLLFSDLLISIVLIYIVLYIYQEKLENDNKKFNINCIVNTLILTPFFLIYLV